jgi:ketosteroid isomerase-like protein
MQTIEASHALDILDRDELARIVRRFWQQRLADGEGAVRAYVHPDISFRVIGAPGTQGVSVHQGVEAVVEAVRMIDTNLEISAFAIIDLIVDGRFVGLLWRSELRHRGTGVVGDLSVFDLIEFSNGRIISYTEFLDTDGFARLMTGEPQPKLSRRSNTMMPPIVRTEAVPSAMGDIASRDHLEAVVRGFFQDRWSEGSACLRRHCTDACTVHLVGDVVQVPFARSHVGIDAVTSLFDQIDMEFALESGRILRVLVDGDRAAVHWSAELRHRGTGACDTIEAFDHIVLDGDRIQAITGFFDTATTADCIKG